MKIIIIIMRLLWRFASLWSLLNYHCATVVGAGKLSPASVFASTLSGKRLEFLGELRWRRKTKSALNEKENNIVTITANEPPLHEIRGFGASFLESGAMNLNRLSPEVRAEVLDLVFSKAGFSLMKAPMLCDDFCAAEAWSTYDDTPGDVNMKNFSIARDLLPTGTLTFIKKALKYGNFTLQSYMDYPPDWMLEGALPDKATVDPKYYDALARYFADFIKAYAEHGANISYFSLFNEPVDSYTDIDPSAMAELLGNHVGPTFDRLGLRPGTKLTYGGQCSRASAGTIIPQIMMSHSAAKYIDHFAYHGYDCQFNCTKDRQNYDAIASLHKQWPGKEMLMTEICYAYVFCFNFYFLESGEE